MPFRENFTLKQFVYPQRPIIGGSTDVGTLGIGTLGTRDSQGLEPWAFSPLFEVDNIVKLPSIDLQSALLKADVDYIDGYKTDSQGTDLRIFNSLSKEIIQKY